MPDARLRVGLVTNIYAPYKEALLAELANRVDLHVFYCAEREPNRHWKVSFSGKYRWEVLRGVTLGLGQLYLHVNPSIVVRLAREPLDVLVVGGYSNPTMLLAMVAAKRKQIPVVLWSGSTERERSLLRPVTRLLKSALVPRFDSYIAYTSAAAHYLVTLGAPPHLIAVAPATVDVEGFNKRVRQVLNGTDKRALRRSLGLPTTGVVLLFVGQMIYRKGGDVLLQALASLRNSDIHLAMVGTGPLQKRWMGLSRKLGIGERVHWFGHLDQRTLVLFYASSDIFVLPSRSEPAGKVINEAMACGLPVIVTDRIGTDAPRDGMEGFVVPAGSIDDLARSIEVLAASEELRKEMGRKAEQRILEEFTVQKEADGFIHGLQLGIKRSCSFNRGKTG